MAVNSFREDEKVVSKGKWVSIFRLLSYLKEHEVEFDYYYACGPEVMLKFLKMYSELGCLSLEARMGCGFGACMGCSIQTTNGPKRVCKEGPVFDAREVIF